MSAVSRRDLLGTFAHHRVASNLLMLLMILAGLWALSKLNTQFFPNFTLDIINVLAEVEDLQLEGSLLTREDAQAFVRQKMETERNAD